MLRRVGQGGMGVVSAAYDNELDRKIAVKRGELYSALAVSPDASLLVTREYDGRTRVWEVSSGRVHPTPLGSDPNAKHMASRVDPRASVRPAFVTAESFLEVDVDGILREYRVSVPRDPN